MLLESISNALDFNAGSKCTRPVIKFGLDPQLDASWFLEVYSRTFLLNF